jgi:hypothetical protein
MALVIEDGSGVDGAESFATVTEARAFATKRGVTLSATDSVVESALRNAADFLNSLESRYKGSRTNAEQALCWPRTDVELFGVDFAVDEIPVQLGQAQCQLCIDINAGTVLMPTGAGREVIRTKVDVIETEYAKSGSGTVMPELNKAMAFLEPLFNGGLSVRSYRV